MESKPSLRFDTKVDNIRTIEISVGFTGGSEEFRKMFPDGIRTTFILQRKQNYQPMFVKTGTWDVYTLIPEFTEEDGTTKDLFVPAKSVNSDDLFITLDTQGIEEILKLLIHSTAEVLYGTTVIMAIYVVPFRYMIPSEENGDIVKGLAFFTKDDKTTGTYKGDGKWIVVSETSIGNLTRTLSDPEVLEIIELKGDVRWVYPAVDNQTKPVLFSPNVARFEG